MENYVFVVGKDNKVSKREVKIGINDDFFYAVESGVSVGERVITVADEKCYRLSLCYKNIRFVS